MVAELDALRKAGVEEQLARDAARAVLGVETRTDLVTKADLAAGLGELKADVIRLINGRHSPRSGSLPRTQTWRIRN